MPRHSNVDAKRKLVGAKKLSAELPLNVGQILRDLEETASISERDLVSYLDVADKTLRNWRTSKMVDAHSGKVLRLRRLKEVVDAALEKSFSKPLIRQLLVAPLDVNDQSQRSIVDVIKTEPESEFFPQLTSLLVQNFRARQNGHFVLSNDDFDRFVRDLEIDREPSPKVKSARDQFLKLRKKSAK